MNFTLSHPLRRFGVASLTATLLVGVGTTQTPKHAITPLTDAQAKVLIEKSQALPATPLTPSENKSLVQYMVAKGTQTSAPVGASTPPDETLLRMGAPGTPIQGAVLSPATTMVAGAKKSGVIRIGMAVTKADFGQGQGAGSGESVRALLSQYLGGPKIEVIALAALLHQQTEAEAKERECDYVVYSSLVQKKASSGGMGFLKNASPMLSMVPMLGMASGAAGAMAAASAASVVASGASSMAGQVKAKSDVTFEYQLVAPGNTVPVLTNKSTLHAKVDGDDVITPLIEAAATSIVGKLNPQK